MAELFLAVIFLMNGLNHLIFKRSALTGYAAAKNVPAPGIAVFISGLLILLGGLGVLLGVYVQWAIAALVIFLLVVSIKMHPFWKEQDPNQRMAEMINFSKNLALLGAALMMLVIATPWPISL